MRNLQSDLLKLDGEQKTRETIRTSLTDWAKLALEPAGQSPAAHHNLLINELEKVASGATDRLMLLLPPGSAKSTYASVIFPAWWFAQHTRSSIIAASHTADLAQHFGRQVRDLVASQGERLGYTLAPHNRAAGRWRTSSGGEYFAAGIRGPVTGRRADLANPGRFYCENATMGTQLEQTRQVGVRAFVAPGTCAHPQVALARVQSLVAAGSCGERIMNSAAVRGCTAWNLANLVRALDVLAGPDFYRRWLTRAV